MSSAKVEVLVVPASIFAKDLEEDTAVAALVTVTFADDFVIGCPFILGC